MEELKEGMIGLHIIKDGRIAQLGLTKEQHVLLEIFLNGLSSKKSFKLLPDNYDFILKREVLI